MSSSASNGTSAAKKWRFFNWFTDKQSSENVAADIESQIPDSSVELTGTQSTDQTSGAGPSKKSTENELPLRPKLSLLQLCEDGRVPDYLENVTFFEAISGGYVALDGEINLTIMVNGAAKSWFGEGVSCYEKSIEGLKGGRRVCMGFIVLLTVGTVLSSTLLGLAIGKCKGKKHHSNRGD